MAETRQAHRSHLAFRDTPFGRQAYMLGTRLWVWEIVKAYRALGQSVSAVAGHFEIDSDLVIEALGYAELHSDEIEHAVHRHGAITLEELAETVPNLEVFDAVEDIKPS